MVYAGHRAVTIFMSADDKPSQHEACAESSTRRRRLLRLVRFASFVLACGLLYILTDFAIDWRPATVQEYYRFTLPPLDFDQPRILQQDNLQLVIIRRSSGLLRRLQNSPVQLQDATSARSRQPADVDGRHRAHHAEYFVAYAIGTDFGCPLLIEVDSLRESCGKARYDFAGRAYRGDRRFSNLPVPDYNLSPDFRILTVFP